MLEAKLKQALITAGPSQWPHGGKTHRGERQLQLDIPAAQSLRNAGEACCF